MSGTVKSIRFEKVAFGYKGKPRLFEGLDLELKSKHPGLGHVVALMGASGAGKTTLINLILRAEKPDSGKIHVEPDVAVIAYVPQEPVLFDHLSSLQNARYFATSSAYSQFFDEDFFKQLCGVLEMESVLSDSGSVLELSGGQRQRLMLLRALSVRPGVIILDEPTTGIGAETKLQFLMLLREIVLKNELFAIYCTHNKTEVELIADEVVFIGAGATGGRNVFQGDLEHFLETPPNIEALKVFRYPSGNILACALNGEGDLIPAAAGAENLFYLGIEPQNIAFSEIGKIHYSIVNRNAAYTQIKIEEQFLILPAAFTKACSGGQLDIEGSALQYGADGAFLKWAQLTKGRLKKER